MPIVDGQAIRETHVIRSTKLRKPIERTVSYPARISASVSGLFGTELRPIFDEITHRQKTIKIVHTRLRWMKPGPDGRPVPR